MLANLVGDVVTNVVLVKFGADVVGELALVEIDSPSLSLPHGDVSEGMLGSKTEDSNVIPEDNQSGDAFVVLGTSQVISLVWRR